MVKKFIATLLLVLLFAGAAYCESFSDKKYSIGLDLPFLGFLQRNDKGQIEANLGINLGLGISYKRYFSPLKLEEISPFWAVGSILVIYPYVGLGAEYVWPSGWYLGGGVLVLSGVYLGQSPVSGRPLGITVMPEIHGGYMF